MALARASSVLHAAKTPERFYDTRPYDKLARLRQLCHERFRAFAIDPPSAKAAMARTVTWLLSSNGLATDRPIVANAARASAARCRTAAPLSSSRFARS
jgi:hypothetical protein